MARCFVAALLVALLQVAPAIAQVPPAGIDALVRNTMQQWQAPGLALVVIHEGRLIQIKGFGRRELGKPDPVTADTVFPLASCTKSFTALALGMLADEKALDWDDPVRKHVPFFHLSDPLADRDVTLRDLVTHRTGLGAHDMLWYRSPANLEGRIRKLARLELDHPFRSAFEYQVVAFGAAGLAVGHATGGTWEDFVRRRVFDPLGMKSARCTFDPGQADRASPHRKDAAGKVAVIPRYPLAEPDPAGSIHASARDLANYLRFQLGDGTWRGTRLVSAANLAEPHRPQVVIPREGLARTLNPETQFLNYGMGWVVQDYRGRRMLLHGGAIDGFRTQLTLVPELGIGIGVVSNLDRGFMNLALTNTLTDLYMNVPPKDWSSYYLHVVEEQRKAERTRIAGFRAKAARSGGPPRPAAAYTGTYADPAYGPSEVVLENGRLVWKWGVFRCPLEHVEADAFLAHDAPADGVVLRFEPDPAGRVEALRVFDRVFRRK
jgi:CubicO group peptidase (beta-lactamase class C family)